MGYDFLFLSFVWWFYEDCFFLLSFFSAPAMQNFFYPPHARLFDSALTKALLFSGICLSLNAVSFRCMLFWDFLFVCRLHSFRATLTSFSFVFY